MENTKKNLKNIVVHGDSIDILKNYDDNSIDAVICDPPYALGFMGQSWDKVFPAIEIWQQCLRVLKPGAWALVMASPRQDVLSRMIINLDDAGFQMYYTSMYWAYLQGFPHGGNIAKLIDKKLGVEPIQGKPKSYTSPDFYESQYTDQGSMMFTHQTSGRVTMHDTTPRSAQAKKMMGAYAGFQPKPAVEVIIMCMKPLSDDALDDPNRRNDKKLNSKHFDLEHWYSQFVITPKPSPSERERGLDGHKTETVGDGRAVNSDTPHQRGNTQRKNMHPTVKPVKLMAYLISMVSREGDTILDPFLGSGATAIAAQMLKRNWVGIERDPKYAMIAQSRIDSFESERKKEMSEMARLRKKMLERYDDKQTKLH